MTIRLMGTPPNIQSLRFGQGQSNRRDLPDQVRDLATLAQEISQQGTQVPYLKQQLPRLAEAYSMVVRHIRNDAVLEGVLLEKNHPTTKLLTTVQEKFTALFEAWIAQIPDPKEAKSLVKAILARSRFLSPKGHMHSLLDPDLKQALVSWVRQKQIASTQSAQNDVSQLAPGALVTGHSAASTSSSTSTTVQKPKGISSPSPLRTRSKSASSTKAARSTKKSKQPLMQAIKDWFACLFKPVTWLFNQLRSGILWCLGMKPKTTRS